MQGWAQIIVFCAVLTAIVPLLGGYMARVFTGERVFLSPVVGPLERLTYRALRVDPDVSQGWKSYAGSLLVFSGVFWLFLYLILRTQTLHPWNPARAISLMHCSNVTPMSMDGKSSFHHRVGVTPSGTFLGSSFLAVI